MNKVIGIGNALVDIIIRLKNEEILDDYALPKGSMQLVDENTAVKIENNAKGCETILTSGGSAANTIHGLARLGVKTGFIGKIGHDKHGDFFKNDLILSGIKPFIYYGNDPTGRAITLVSPDSERTFATFLGSSMELDASDLDHIPSGNYSLLHIEGYLVENRELVRTTLQLARMSGMKTSLDLASYNVVEGNKEFLKNIIPDYVDIVFANEEEAYSFTGKKPEEAVEEISRICQIAIVKTGKSGSVIQRSKERYKIGIFDTECIDTTGAGDLYAAGFLYGVLNNLALVKCGKIGALLSARVIEYLGAKIPESEWTKIIKTKVEIESD